MIDDGRTPRVTRAVETDWDRFRELRLAALDDTPDAFGSLLAHEVAQPETWWRELLSRSRRATLVASLDRRDAGLCTVASSFDDPAVAGLYAMWVAPFARGAGVGDALIERAIAEARSLGWSRMVLDVGDANATAIALYARHGFTPTGRTSTLDPPREHVTEHERAREL